MPSSSESIIYLMYSIDVLDIFIILYKNQENTRISILFLILIYKTIEW